MKDSFQPVFRVEKITPESKAIDGLEMIYERLGKPEWDIKNDAFTFYTINKGSVQN
jgi:hypothetical protein